MIDNSRAPDFSITIEVPFQRPSTEAVEQFKSHFDPFLSALIDAGYLTEEEAVAYIAFVTDFSLYPVFVMDSFLVAYRRMKAASEESAIQKPTLYIP
jgi:hypothetical protein